jgi:hypothetical protein
MENPGIWHTIKVGGREGAIDPDLPVHGSRQDPSSPLRIYSAGIFSFQRIRRGKDLR